MSARRADEGFTYAEMLVAMTLMLIVMSVMWAGLQVAQKGSNVGQNQAYFEQNIGGPMQAFLVRGTFRMARDWTKFAKEVAADSPEAAVERVD